MHCGQGYHQREGKKIKQEHRAHIDEACYTHQVPKAESEKEHACLVGINMEQHHV